MGVVNSSELVGDNIIDFALDGLNECRILNGRINRYILLWLDGVADINPNNSLSPFLKLRHLLP